MVLELLNCSNKKSKSGTFVKIKKIKIILKSWHFVPVKLRARLKTLLAKKGAALPESKSTKIHSYELVLYLISFVLLSCCLVVLSKGEFGEFGYQINFVGAVYFLRALLKLLQDLHDVLFGDEPHA